MHRNTEKFVHDWINAWNSMDLKRILSHYSADIEITTPMISMATGSGDSTLTGKGAVEAYWRKALEKLPDLNFELLDWAEGVECVSIHYKSVMGMIAIETMWFDEHGKICRMNACYRKVTYD